MQKHGNSFVPHCISSQKSVYSQVDYLSFILSKNRIAMDPVKLKGIEQWTTPTTIKQVWSFLGFGNYYRKFIKDYGNLMKPLNELLKKDKKFEWTDKAQQAFNTLKGKFQAAPVLQLKSFLGFRNYYRKFIKDYGNLTLLNKLLKKEKKFEWTDEVQQAFDTLKGKFQAAPVLQLPDPYKPFMVECDTSNTHLEQYYRNRIRMQTGIPVLTYQNHSVTWNGTMNI